eukprot:scpid62973/ scgid29073/ 
MNCNESKALLDSASSTNEQRDQNLSAELHCLATAILPRSCLSHCVEMAALLPVLYFLPVLAVLTILLVLFVVSISNSCPETTPKHAAGDDLRCWFESSRRGGSLARRQHLTLPVSRSHTPTAPSPVSPMLALRLSPDHSPRAGRRRFLFRR